MSMTSRKRDVLPASLAPRGLSREEAAAYIGVSATLFYALVADGRMPQPKRINSRKVWDRFLLDPAFEASDDDQGDSNWADVDLDNHQLHSEVTNLRTG